MPDSTVLVFAKAPQPGRVNTRMTPPLTTEQAAQVHTRSLHVVWRNLVQLDASAELIATPDSAADEMASLLGADPAQCYPQGDGDLGTKLARAFQRAFQTGAKHVLALGADSPTLPIARLHDALRTLNDHEAVIGPCDDGGYYLIGLSAKQDRPARHFELFHQINWGSSEVADQTVAQAKRNDIDLALLDPWYDLDKYSDLARAAADLRELAHLTDEHRHLLHLLDDLLARYGMP